MDGGGDITHSELVPHSGHSRTVVREYHGPPATTTLSFRLPNAAAARALQAARIGTEQGRYDFLTNSCLTHVCDVLRAGGVTDLPDTGTRMVHWAKTGLHSAFREDG
jgi:hypothetical protein